MPTYDEMRLSCQEAMGTESGLNRIPDAQRAIASRNNPAIGIITWIEVLTGTDGAEEHGVRALLDSFELISITPQIAEESAAIRRAIRLKLPDAIILASARLGLRPHHPKHPGLRSERPWRPHSLRPPRTPCSLEPSLK